MNVPDNPKSYHAVEQLIREKSHNTTSKNQEFQNTTQKTNVAKIPLQLAPAKKSYMPLSLHTTNFSFTLKSCELGRGGALACRCRGRAGTAGEATEQDMTPHRIKYGGGRGRSRRT
jgi:hypothetical protein